MRIINTGGRQPPAKNGQRLCKSVWRVADRKPKNLKLEGTYSHPATDKTAANPYSTFHKSFFKILMQLYVFMYLEEIVRSRTLKFGLISQKPPQNLA
jgi:hypothetical protein